MDGGLEGKAIGSEMIEYGVKVKFGILPDPDDIEADPILLHNIVDRMNGAVFAASILRTVDQEIEMSHTHYDMDSWVERMAGDIAEVVSRLWKGIVTICTVCLMKRNTITGGRFHVD